MAFLKNTWYVFGYSGEVLAETLKGRIIAEEPILVYRKTDGELAAIRDVCPHRFVPLHMGKKVGDDIQCGYHGLRFNAAGQCVHNPVAGAPIPKAAKVRSYPVAERDTLIWVWLGDHAAADLDLIPDFSFLGDPNRADVAGYSLMAADYQLAIDNLSDLTHVQFVHEEYQASEAFDRLKLEVRQEGNSVYTTLTFPNGRPAFFFQNAVENPDEPIDLTFTTRWNPPSCVKLQVEGFEVGSGKKLFSTLSAHLVMPETAKTSHYFYINSRDYQIDSKEADERVRSWQKRGFDGEDKPMIEAQQRCVRDQDIMTLGPVLLPTDAGAIRVRRILGSMMEKEGLPSAPAERFE